MGGYTATECTLSPKSPTTLSDLNSSSQEPPSYPSQHRHTKTVSIPKVERVADQTTYLAYGVPGSLEEPATKHHMASLHPGPESPPQIAIHSTNMFQTHYYGG
ncbi:UNVERIFIED_CONTAM: hypothetical protein Sradi_2992100 [Sesamum radiatum]|uniref:Uncharacterized protein n=1 Tax=Sesamum radiatum TaxID=300843 RepID=A0AAW2S0J8_SESRA